MIWLLGYNSAVATTGNCIYREVIAPSPQSKVITCVCNLNGQTRDPLPLCSCGHIGARDTRNPVSCIVMTALYSPNTSYGPRNCEVTLLLKFPHVALSFFCRTLLRLSCGSGLGTPLPLGLYLHIYSNFLLFSGPGPAGLPWGD